MDAEALRRSTSLYLPTHPIPMLPPRVSEDLASLNADGDRAALTLFATLSPEGEGWGATTHPYRFKKCP